MRIVTKEATDLDECSHRDQWNDGCTQLRPPNDKEKCESDDLCKDERVERVAEGTSVRQSSVQLEPATVVDVCELILERDEGECEKDKVERNDEGIEKGEDCCDTVDQEILFIETSVMAHRREGRD